MIDPPAPLTPLECDLRDFAFMPLDVRRLRDSDLANEEAPEVCWAALLLWGASWHQVPAASLPENDRVLSNLAGFGKVVSAWLEVRAGALRGFVKCTDGRLYHPVVAEKAREAWRGKLGQRWRTECARIKKANQRHGANDPFPTFDEFLASLSPGTRLHVSEDIAPRPQGQPAMSPACPLEIEVQGTGTGTGTGIEEEADASLPTSTEETIDLFEALWNAYPHVRGRSSRPKSQGTFRRLPLAHRQALPSAAARYASDGREPKDDCGAPGLHVWLKDQRYLDWLVDHPTPLAITAPFEGPPNLRAAAIDAKSEGWVRSYLDTARYDSATGAVTPKGATAEKELRGILPILIEHGTHLVEPRRNAA